MKFIENRKKFYAISLVIIILGLLAMIFNGVKGNGSFAKDIEFTGGSYIQFDLEKSLTEDLRSEIAEITTEVTGDKNPRITSADNTGVIVTVQRADASTRKALFEKLKEHFGLSATQTLADSDVSPTISDEIKFGAIKAVVVGTILILIYITFRFKDFKFGLSAVTALAHDVLIMLAVYAIFRVPLNNSFIAAMLTIVGYSINDTIIVFDRIRENRDKRGGKVDTELVNESIGQTVGRSINTSITTIIMVVLLFFLGTDAVKQFAFPLIIGVAAGTYSSIFVASPLWYDLRNVGKNKKTEAKNA